MVIYECDMCGKQFQSEDAVHQIKVHGKEEDDNQFLGENIWNPMICRECSRKVGDFIHGYKSRMKGLNCTIDSRFKKGEP